MIKASFVPLPRIEDDMIEWTPPQPEVLQAFEQALGSCHHFNESPDTGSLRAYHQHVQRLERLKSQFRQQDEHTCTDYLG